MPKIIVIGHLLLKLLYKMYSHMFFLGHNVELHRGNANPRRAGFRFDTLCVVRCNFIRFRDK